MDESTSASYPQRTEWNVRDSDGTVIFTIGPTLTGGSKKTAEFAKKHKKPWLHLTEDKPLKENVELLTEFLKEHQIKVLNVAGSRASKEPGIGDFVRSVLQLGY